MEGRKLRLLLINDQDVGIANPYIEVVICPNPIGDDIPQLKYWPQHMHLWGNDCVPDFDLLLVDIKFEWDTFDPYYFGEKEAEGTQSEAEGTQSRVINPFGLLHALPLAARQDLTNMPFVWGVHSGDPSAVKDDPVAIWAFGLLCAMERRAGWDGYDPTQSIPAYFSEQIESLQALAPEAACAELIGRYRQRLKESCEGGRVYIEPDSLKSLISKVEEAMEANFDELANETLDISSFYEDHHILLRSLFADFYTWNQSVKRDILEYLGSPKFCIGDLKNPQSFLLALKDPPDLVSKYIKSKFTPDVRQLLDEYDGSDPSSESLQSRIVDVLNQLLTDSPLYDEQRFVRVNLSENTHKLIDRNPQGEGRIRLNRLLLEQAYPHDIAKSQYLKGLKAISEDRTDIFPQVIESLRILRQDSEAGTTLTQALPAVNKASIGVGVIVCLWLERVFGGLPIETKEILADMGFYTEGKQPNYQQPNRWLQESGFNVPIKKFLARLSTDPLPPLWRACGQRYWTQILEKDSGTKNLNWPACLGRRSRT